MIIDVQARTITIPRNSARFVALSYMWFRDDKCGLLRKVKMSSLETSIGLGRFPWPSIVQHNEAMDMLYGIPEKYLRLDMQ